MFTVEMDTDFGESCTVTSLDDDGDFLDVIVKFFEDAVYIIQYNDDDIDFTISMSPRQWLDIISSLELPSGSYRLEERKIQ